jgi:hypothetical protein
MTLIGQLIETPSQGFGTDYPGAINASQLIEVWAKGGCEKDPIVVDTPRPGTRIYSPLRVTGRARGTWFFEGDFPIVLLDSNHTVISQGYCTAKGNWMTEQFVQYEGILYFDPQNKNERGILELKKDNPTGNAVLDDDLKIPIIFN